MEKKRVQPRGALSQVKVGGQDEHKPRYLAKRADTYQNVPGSNSSNAKYRRGGGRYPPRNSTRDSKHSLPQDAPKRSSNKVMDEMDSEKSEDVVELKDEVTSFQDSKDRNGHGFNSKFAQANRPYGRQGYKPRQSWHTHFKPHMYNKESYLQANCRFVVQEHGDYALHSVDPDKLVDWNLIEQIYLFSHDTPSCPICLENPRVARITRCGHVYCWSCILHYLQLSEKPWRKCPICYEAIIQADLKSVVTSSTRKFATGETITMQLMQRKKGSMISKQFASRANSESRVIQWKGDMRSVIQSVHAKLLKASSKIVYEKIVSPEMKELQQQLEEAKSEQSGEECFIENAIHLLQEKEKELLKCMQKLEGKEIIREKDLEDVPASVSKVQKIMDVLQDKMGSVDVDDPAFSDDEQDEAIKDANETATTKADEPKPQKFESESLPVPERQEHCGNATLSSAADCYYYYQAVDGQNVYLQPVNIRCLITEYGNLQCCPDKVTAQIIDMESFSMTKELRKRFRYLSHLPLACEFTFCELMIRPPVLSRETLSKFADEFYQRKVTRQRKKREEKKFQRKIENKMTMDSFGREFEKHAETASLNLQSLDDFPSQIGSSSPENGPLQAGISAAWGASTFANALQKAPQAVTRRREEPKVRRPSEPSSTNGCKSDDVIDEDYVPVPSFAMSFSDALHSALEKQSSSANNPKGDVGGKSRKKQKGKKLLFTTSSAPKYT